MPPVLVSSQFAVLKPVKYGGCVKVNDQKLPTKIITEDTINYYYYNK